MSLYPRRLFLRYLAGGTLGATALSFLTSQSSRGQEVDLEILCSSFPYNSRCENYLLGVRALDEQDHAIAVASLLGVVQSGDRIPVKGLERDAYLVIETGPAIATYGISAVCTHLGCTVHWEAENNRFQCPCHGSQYDSEGRVIHGPASHNLHLVTAIVRQDQIRLVERSPAVDPRH